MATSKSFIKRRPVLIYYVLTFVISWGGILMAIGPGGILGTKELSEALLPFVYVALLAGPSISGLLLTGLVYGRAGFRDLLSRLIRCRVGARWWAVALLTAPLLFSAVLFVLSRFSSQYIPAIFASNA